MTVRVVILRVVTMARIGNDFRPLVFLHLLNPCSSALQWGLALRMTLGGSPTNGMPLFLSKDAKPCFTARLYVYRANWPHYSSVQAQSRRHRDAIRTSRLTVSPRDRPASAPTPAENGHPVL